MKLTMLVEPTKRRGQYIRLGHKQSILKALVEDNILSELNQSSRFIWKATITEQGMKDLEWLERTLRFNRIAYKKLLDEE